MDVGQTKMEMNQTWKKKVEAGGSGSNEFEVTLSNKEGNHTISN